MELCFTNGGIYIKVMASSGHGGDPFMHAFDMTMVGIQGFALSLS